MRIAVGAFCLACAGLLASHVALGNGPEVGRDAGMIFPVASDSIQLVSEQVTIKLHLDDYEGTAKCAYVLRNLTDAPARFEMAFVTNPPFDPTPEGYRHHYEDAHFLVSLDEKPLEVRYAAMAPGRWSELTAAGPDSLPVWWVELGLRATRRLTMAYKVSWSGFGDGGHAATEFTYYARPAALWAGRIDSADIRFDIGTLPDSEDTRRQGVDSVRVSIEPAGFKRNGGVIRWRFTNWEPSSDLSFRYDSYSREP